jgi:hypothetical protein
VGFAPRDRHDGEKLAVPIVVSWKKSLVGSLPGRIIVYSVALVAVAAFTSPAVPAIAGEPERSLHVHVDLPDTSADPIRVSTTGITIGIQLPKAAEASISQRARGSAALYRYPDDREFAVTPDSVGGVALETILTTEAAPKRLVFGLSLPTGAGVEILDSGAVAITNGRGEWIAGVVAPSAKDAVGRDVPTHYELESDSLVQVVTTSESGSTYPVKAGVRAGLDMIERVRWVSAGSSRSTLQVTPTALNRAMSGSAPAATAGWNEVARRAPGSNTTNMMWQYKCHQAFAPIKATWNLDDWIRRASYADSIANGCN